MKSKQTMFFAMYEDIKQVFQDIEITIDIRYYKAGLLNNDHSPTYNSIFDTPNIGIVLSGDWNKVDNYLILKSTRTLNIREVRQRTGELKFAVDQMTNLKSVELKLGGVYKDNIIVAGRIATISEDEESIEIYKLISTKIKKAFKKIGSFYVGKIAEEKLKEGWRLVTNEKSPKEYDLALN